MSKADEINLVEAISLLKEMQDNALIACRCYKTGGVLYRDEKAEKKANAIETVLNYIDNSISKEVIKKLLNYDKTNYIDCIKANNKIEAIREYIKHLEKELLEGK